MARYWVGGTGNWSDTAHWAASTGGAGGQSVPTGADDVFLDGNSGSGIVTNDINTNLCRNFDCTGYVGTLAMSQTLTLNPTAGGTVTLASGMTITGGAALVIASAAGANAILTTNGKALSNVTINASTTGGVTIADTWTVTHAVTLTQGTLNTNGQTCTWESFVSSNSNTRTLTLGASNITINLVTNNAVGWDFSTVTGLTFNCGTSTITFTGVATDFRPGGKTFNNLVWNNFQSSFWSGGATVANLTFTRNALVTPFGWNIDSTITITGTLTLNGDSVYSILVQKHTFGTSVSIVAAALVCTNRVDFMDIAASGAATWSAAASGATFFGDATGNTGITFTTPATQTWQGPSGGSWSDPSKWTSRVPLPQDDVNFNGVAFSAGQTIVVNMPRLGKNIDFSGCTGTPTLQYGTGAQLWVFGSLNFTGLASPVTTGGNASGFYLAGRSAFNLTTNGIFLPSGAGVDFRVQAPGGTYTLQDNVNFGCSFLLSGGTFNANNFNLTAFGFQANAVAAVTINMGSGIWTAIGSTGNLWNATPGPTINAQTSTILFSNTNTSLSRTFAGGGFTYNKFQVLGNTSTGALAITGNNTFNVIDIQAQAAVTLTLPASGTQTIKQVCAIYASSGQTISVVSSTPATGTTITLQANNALPQFWNHSFSGDITVTLPTKIRYWVGGPATWDTTTTTHWSASSGGAGGASVPDSTTVVVFDANSGLTAAGAPNGVIQINNNVTCGGLALGGLTSKNFQLRVSNSAGGPTFAAGNYSFMGADEWTPCCIPSNTIGITSTFTINGTHALHKWVHFRDIAIAGSAGTLSGTLIGDMLGNSGITFEPSVTQTWQGTVSGNWSDPTKWSSRVPLPQDDVIIKSGFSASQTITLDMSRIGRNIDFTGTTGSPAFSKSGANGATQYMFGSLTSAPGVSMPGGNTFVFGGRGQHTLTLMNMAWGFTITFQAPGATYKMMGHMLQSASGTFSIDAGTWDFNGFNMNIRSGGSVSAASSSWVSAIILGSGTHRFGGNAVGSALAVNSTNSFLTGNNGGTIIFQSQGSNFTIASNTPGSNIDLSKETLIFYDTSPVGATMTISATTNVHIGGIIYRTPGRGNLSILGVNLTIDTLDIESSGTLTLSATRTYNINNLLLRGWGQGNESVGPPLNVVSSAPGTGVTVNVTGILEKSNVTFTADVPINQTGTLVGYQKSPNSFDYFNNPGFDQNQQNLFFPVSYFTGEVFSVLMAPTKTTWNFDYFLANGEPISVLERYGLPYTEDNSIRSVTSVTDVEEHSTYDANSIRSKTTPVGTDIAQFFDAVTIRTPSKLSISDIAAYIEAGTITSKSRLSISDIAIFVDAATINTISRLLTTELHTTFDSATIRSKATFTESDILLFLDTVSIRSKTTFVINDVAQFLDTLAVVSKSKLVIADIQSIHDTATIRVVSKLGIFDISIFRDSGTIRSKSTLAVVRFLPVDISLSAKMFGRWSGGMYNKFSARLVGRN